MVFSAFTGEFAVQADEAAFLQHKQAQTQTLLGFTLVFCASFYMAFSLTDFAVLGAGPTFLQLLGARVLVAVTAGSCAWLAYRRELSIDAARIAACVSEAVALGCFMIIAAKRTSEFHWHAMSLAIMLIVIYLYIPNSFINAMVLALFATSGFLALALNLSDMTPADVLTMTMLLTLANAFGALAARRFNIASREEYRAQTELKFAAERDHLTGCFNRRYLQDNLMDAELLRAQRFGHSLSLVICDIDNFKRINDTYGHADGDAVIRAFAGLLRRSTREGVDSVVRYGGEEFLILLPETDLAGGLQLAERMRASFAASAVPSMHGDASMRTTASFGVATVDFANDGGRHTIRDLISAADKLMYDAKRAGRDRVRALQLD
jgi:diguanylate cyclase (GGDEF)-like protein